MNSHDRNFDDMSQLFSKNIYGTTKGRLREIQVWKSLEAMLSYYPKNQSLSILDAGGGQGQLSIKLAKLGHQVTICDISSQMLAVAKSRAQEQNILLNYFHGSIQALAASQSSTKFDIILCHAVLEWVSDPMLILTSLKKLLHANGHLSLMFFNWHALLFKTMTLGNFGYLDAGLAKRKKKTLSPDYPRKPEDVYDWLTQLEFSLTKKIGIRLFHDYLIDKHKQTTEFTALLTLEQQFSETEPYLSLARYILITATHKKALC